MLQPRSTLTFPQELYEKKDLSAIALSETCLLIGADEGHIVQVLKPEDEHTYRLQDTLVLVNDPETEADIEDICCVGSSCYVIGSHSRKRKKMKPDEKSREENRERLYKPPKPEPTREVLFRLTLDSETHRLSLQEQMSLSDIIKNDKLLKQFIDLPSKENGIDIEGLAIRGDRLFVGFRSPVFRGNYVPILSVNADDLGQPKLDFIQMEGRGVRAMTETHDGFLIVGGPPGDGEISYNLYLWEGNDMIPGNNLETIEPLKNLGQIPCPTNAKAEGLALLAETDEFWQILLVYDGIIGGQPTIYNIQK